MLIDQLPRAEGYHADQLAESTQKRVRSAARGEVVILTSSVGSRKSWLGSAKTEVAEREEEGVGELDNTKDSRANHVGCWRLGNRTTRNKRRFGVYRSGARFS